MPSPNLRQIGTWSKQKKEKEIKNFWNVILNGISTSQKKHRVTCLFDSRPPVLLKQGQPANLNHPYSTHSCQLKAPFEWYFLSSTCLQQWLHSWQTRRRAKIRWPYQEHTERGCPKSSLKGTLTYQNFPPLHARHCRAQHCSTDPLNPVKRTAMHGPFSEFRCLICTLVLWAMW